jgi:hypothetical protein
MTVRDELLTLKGNNEFLIVEEAHEWARTHPESKLHKALEWDDRIAAREHRFSQIRRLVAIHIVTGEGVREMISLSIDRTRDGGGYRGLNDILSNQSLHEVMLADALRELERLQAKYQQLQALAPLWQAVAQVRRTRGRGRGRRGEARATA